MKKIYNSKAFWMIVSLLASLAIWVYVTSVETDESKTTFRGVKVELVGEDILRDSKNLVVTDMDTSTVTVEVVGPRRIIGSLRGLRRDHEVYRLRSPAVLGELARIRAVRINYRILLRGIRRA